MKKQLITEDMFKEVLVKNNEMVNAVRALFGITVKIITDKYTAEHDINSLSEEEFYSGLYIYTVKEITEEYETLKEKMTAQGKLEVFRRTMTIFCFNHSIEMCTDDIIIDTLTADINRSIQMDLQRQYAIDNESVGEELAKQHEEALAEEEWSPVNTSDIVDSIV